MSQTAKFHSVVIEGLPELSSDVMQGWIENPKAVAKVLAAFAPVVKETEISNLICVDRAIRPTYPDWVKEVLHPELENSGPAEYDASQLEQWLHDSQKNGGWVKGQVIYDHLVATDTLKDCASLRDLEEIQKKGVYFFRKYFQGKAVYGWKSVVRSADGSLCVPYLYERGVGVGRVWGWLDDVWCGRRPALRFAK